MLRAPVLVLCVLLAAGTVAASGGEYILVPTEHMWTFLRLNTVDGRIHQVTFSVDTGTEEGIYPVNPRPLIADDAERIPGRFTLYPTQNIWNFLLLDTFTGRVWQVQFSMTGPDYRWITPLRVQCPPPILVNTLEGKC